MLFITHALPKTLQVDEIVQIGLPRPGATAQLPVQALGVVGQPS